MLGYIKRTIICIISSFMEIEQKQIERSRPRRMFACCIQVVKSVMDVLIALFIQRQGYYIMEIDWISIFAGKKIKGSYYIREVIVLLNVV